MRTEETRRAELHARRYDRPAQPVCPRIAALWRDGYTVQQIASIMARSVADVRMMTAQLRPPERRGFESANLRRAT
jgi:hypothetical protein